MADGPGAGSTNDRDDPALPRTTESWPDPPATEAPFFHDLSGTGYAPPGSVADPFGAPPPPLPIPSAYGAPASGPPGYPPPGYPPPGYGAPGYGYPGYGGTPYGPYAYGAYAPPRNNGLAIASMVCGIVALVFCQIFCIPALILGFRGRRQIHESQGAETGDAFAIAGLVLGALSAALFVLIIVFYVGLFAFSFAI